MAVARRPCALSTCRTRSDAVSGDVGALVGIGLIGSRTVVIKSCLNLSDFTLSSVGCPINTYNEARVVGPPCHRFQQLKRADGG